MTTSARRWDFGRLSVGADDLGGPTTRPSSIVERVDSHVAPLLGMTEIHCHCEEARRADAAIRIPRPQRLPCVKGAVSHRLTEGLSGVDGPFGVIPAPIPAHSSHPRRRCSAVRRWPGWLLKLTLLPVGADARIGPLLRTTSVAPVGGGLRPAPLGLLRAAVIA